MNGIQIVVGVEMLFNSFVFIGLFLPVTLIVYHLAVRSGHWRLSLYWLILASLIFYGWWFPPYLILILGSIIANFVFGEWLRRTGSTLILVIGVGLNLVLIGVFKYANFFLSTVASIVDAPPLSSSLVLPLAISFFTFQQIAYLVDCQRGQCDATDPLHYAFFVTFFPQLIAGPIVHHNEIIPQLRTGRRGGLDEHDLAAGFALFAIGLVKKVMIADQLALYVDPVFADAQGGIAPGLVVAWGATAAFTLQLYFDFSGYSDMAIGLARLFGIRLPENFDAPYRASSIIDFWRRWHMTLSRFLRDYLYRALGGNRRGRPRQVAAIIVTMLLGGLWHGAGWTFVLWGGIHGVLLAINHVWRAVRYDFTRGSVRPGPFRLLIGWLVTLLCVHFAWVLFRAESFAAAGRIYDGMLGLNGTQLPEYYLLMLGSLGPFLANAGVVFEPIQNFHFDGAEQVLVTGIAMIVAIAGPTSTQLVGRLERGEGVLRSLGWPQGLVAGAAVATALLALYADPPQKFIYFQF